MNIEILFSMSQILLRLISELLTGLACDEGREGESRQLNNWNKTDVNHSRIKAAELNGKQGI